MIVRLFWWRSLAMVPTLLVIVLASFALIRFAPGSPFDGERAISAKVRLELTRRYGLDQPWYRQAWSYMVQVCKADLGPSIKYPGRSVVELLATGMPNTLLLGACAFAWVLLLGIGGGIAAAAWQQGWLAWGSNAWASLAMAMPSFVLGPLLIWLFALGIPLLPAGGFHSWSHLVLPTLTLGTMHGAMLARLLQVALLEVGATDYIRTARAKGVPQWRIWLVHMLPPALLPMLGYVAPVAASLLTGSVVVEQLFAIPGVGAYFVEAANNRDYFLIMGAVLLSSVVLLCCNLCAEICMIVFDPRQHPSTRQAS